MIYDSLPSQLYLLVPWDLPIDEQLSSSDRVKIRQLLQSLLQALNESSSRQALTIVNRELEALKFSSRLAPIATTKSALKPWEVKDFNEYFNLAHVRTEDKSFCIVWGLLTVYKTLLLLDLARDNPDFNSSRIRDLQEGLRSYVYLLGRVFNLSLEKLS